MVFLESALSSKFNPLVTLGRSGSWGLKGFVNKFNADAELLDDLVFTSEGLRSLTFQANCCFKNDHWTSKHHKVINLRLAIIPRSSVFFRQNAIGLSNNFSILHVTEELGSPSYLVMYIVQRSVC
jgi:hypothetical protein